MAKKPVPSQVAVPPSDELHLGLDFAYNDSEEDLYSDSDGGDFSGSGDDFESDVTLEELAGNSYDLTNVQATQSLPRTRAKGGGVPNGDSMALVPAGEGAAGDAYDVDSDEEQDLLKGIKDEIRDMVREEMQSELRVYQHKMKAIEAGRLPSADGGSSKEEDKYPDLADMEPELREAYIKMRKLDRILEKKIKKEKEVKRDRILLERRIREEISAMQSSGKIQRDIQTNTDRYLALALPPSHNQGVIVDEPPVTPVFQTQVNEQDLEERRKKAATTGSSSASSGRGSRQESAASSRTDATASTADTNRRRTDKYNRRRRRKDFIKRNKELAANANDMIAMTDDEKKRLQELLSDVDNLPEIQEEGMDTSVDLNPYQVAIKPGEGFMPSDNELRSLTAIDQRLQSIMPEDQFRSIASSVLSHTPQQRLFTRVGARSEVDFEEYGEKALMETKEEREVTTKLKDIEERLSHFRNAENTQSETSALSEEQLEHLLDDCVRSMSAVSLPVDTPDSIDSSRMLESARAQLLVNPPKLSDEMLQQLLSEAHFPLSTQLLALQDDDSKSAHNEDEGGPIRAETWKAIAEETLSEEEDDHSRAASSVEQRREQSQSPHPPPPKHSTAFPRTSCSDTLVNPTLSRKPPLYRYSSQASDSDGRDSRVSLPEISSTPLINTTQGGGIPNNDPVQYIGSRNGARNSSSLDNMVRNDLSRETPPGSQRMAGTPLTVEDMGDQPQSTPTPHPPSSDRSTTSRRSLKNRKNSLEKEPSS